MLYFLSNYYHFLPFLLLFLYFTDIFIQKNNKIEFSKKILFFLLLVTLLP